VVGLRQTLQKMQQDLKDGKKREDALQAKASHFEQRLNTERLEAQQMASEYEQRESHFKLLEQGWKEEWEHHCRSKDQLQENYQQAMKELDALKGQRGEDSAKIKQLETNKKKTEKKTTEDKKSIQELKEEVKKKDSELTKKDKEVAALKEQLSAKSQEHSTYRQAQERYQMYAGVSGLVVIILFVLYWILSFVSSPSSAQQPGDADL